MLCRLYVDHRENKVHRWSDIWEEKKLDYEHKQLPAGDYIITTLDGRPLVIIERKTYPDFAASIMDGRMKNREKLYKFREKYGCRVVLLIEGEANPTKIVGFKNIRASIDHMILRDNVHVVYTGARGDDGDMLSKKTAKYLAQYCQNTTSLIKNNKQFLQSIDKIPLMDECDFNPGKVVNDVQEQVMKMWCVLPKIGPVTARKMISEITLGKYICQHKLSLFVIVKILAQIRGISKGSAEKIVSHILSEQGSNFDCIDVKMLGELKMGNRKLGKVAAERVIECLSYKR